MFWFSNPKNPSMKNQDPSILTIYLLLCGEDKKMARSAAMISIWNELSEEQN